MTFEAVSGRSLGGGKAVIIGDLAADKIPELLHAYGGFIERLGGAYVTGLAGRRAIRTDRTVGVGGAGKGAST
jgi:glutamate dehydrogenase/leucine dehydrogenase